MSNDSYKKIEIDNPICKRRFHIGWDASNTQKLQVRLQCPHCGVTVYESNSHSPAMILREENLVESPDGSRPLMRECLQAQVHKK